MMAGKERESGTKQRLQFNFSEEAVEELERLKGEIGASSRAEVIRTALAFLKWVVDAELQGNKIYEVNKNEEGEIRNTIKLIFPFRASDRQ